MLTLAQAEEAHNKSNAKGSIVVGATLNHPHSPSLTSTSQFQRRRDYDDGDDFDI